MFITLGRFLASGMMAVERIAYTLAKTSGVVVAYATKARRIVHDTLCSIALSEESGHG